MKYLFDSNTVSDIYNPSSVNHEKLIKKLLTLNDNDEILVSILTIYEFEYAFANSPASKKLKIKKTIQQIKQDFGILQLSTDEAETFGALKREFRTAQSMSKENIKKHTIDLIIFASALKNNFVLVSADKIFASMQLINPKMAYEDWTIG